MSQPDYFSFDDYKVRLAKLDEIRALGVDPYPHQYSPTHEIATVLEQYAEEGAGDFDAAKDRKTDHVIVAGRLVLHRAMGKNIFAHIQEGQDVLQVLFNREETKVVGLEEGLEVTAHKFLEKKLDLGDFIGVEGHLFRTGKGELTVFATSVTLLSKALLPLPDKHAGLVDKEVRYRKRWLDLIANPEVMKTFKMRSRILSLIRAYFARLDFHEVETPVLERVYGGAQAKPFTTHLNALHQEMFMRISLEISLKKLIVGGFSRVFEIGRVFRNEGIDATHNPEFTSIEFYAAYWDYNDVMRFTEGLYEFIAKELFGTTKIGIRKDRAGNEHEIDVKTPWTRLTMVGSIKKYGNIDVEKKSDEELRKILLDKGAHEPKKIHEAPRGILIAMLFEEFVEHHLVQPHFIIDHPIETTPLCKLHRNRELAEKGFVERFEAFILGFEASNAYTELNDPVLQRELLERQDRLLQEGDEEANPIDEEFLESIYQGMPPCGGCGIGIDRLIMLFTGQSSIRDVIFFPLMKEAGVVASTESIS
jgi:lysyl-tRNA synthetase class 2